MNVLKGNLEKMARASFKGTGEAFKWIVFKRCDGKSSKIKELGSKNLLTFDVYLKIPLSEG